MIEPLDRPRNRNSNNVTLTAYARLRGHLTCRRHVMWPTTGRAPTDAVTCCAHRCQTRASQFWLDACTTYTPLSSAPEVPPLLPVISTNRICVKPRHRTPVPLKPAPNYQHSARFKPRHSPTLPNHRLVTYCNHCTTVSQRF